jgi:hypothetical protein
MGVAMTRIGLASAALAVVCLTLLAASGAEAARARCQVVGGGGTYGTLQEAVDSASAGDTLDVSGICNGDTTIDKDLSIIGRGKATLDGTGTSGHVVVVIGFSSVAMTGLTITGGAPTFPGGPEEDEGGDGGGIVNFGSLTLTRCNVTGNRATEGDKGGDNPLPAASVGGGILNEGQLVLDHSTVVGNTAEEGGGIYTLGSETPRSVTAIDSTIARNVGGGIVTDYFGSLSLRHSSVTRNIGVGIENGGAILATLVRSRVTHNTGVGILSEPTSTVILIDSRVAHNGGE